jgi:uncharacterized ion transporter superfamily protein YfcC
MRVRVPHTYVLLFALVGVAAAATHLLPAGEYRRVEEGGRLVVDASSYRQVEARPAGLADVFLAWPRGLAETAPIVFYIFLIGGAFGVVQATGAVEGTIGFVVRACRERWAVVIPVLMVLFSLGGGTIGIAEETLPFLPALVLLARRLGCDEVTGGAIALVGAGAGFSAAFMNPFTVGVAQGIAGLPLFSGLGLRLVAWAVFTAISVVYVTRYAARVRRQEPLAEAAVSDQDRAPGVEPGPAGPPGSEASLSPRQRLVLACLLATLGAIVVGALSWGWGIPELSGLFVALAVVAGVVGGLGADRTAETFLEGAAGIAGGALVVGLARGVLVIFDRARVTDTVLHALAAAVAGLPAAASVTGIYGVQVALSYLVPSGGGQAALSIPILAPLGDLVGVTRQTSVLAYQFGDGFSNVFTPTQGYFMAGLALIRVPWTRWARFMWRLQLLWLAAGFGFLLLAHSIGWGS